MLYISVWLSNGNPLQYSCLENAIDRGAWRATVRGIARVRHIISMYYEVLGNLNFSLADFYYLNFLWKGAIFNALSPPYYRYFYYSKETKVEHSTWEHLRSKFAWGPSLDPKSKFLRVGLEYVFKVSQVSEMAMKKVKTTAINYAIWPVSCFLNSL